MWGTRPVAMETPPIDNLSLQPLLGADPVQGQLVGAVELERKLGGQGHPVLGPGVSSWCLSSSELPDSFFTGIWERSQGRG